MSLPPPQTREFADRLTTLAEECRSELEQGNQALQEIAMLLKQTQTEVDRLSIREQQANVRLREMESSLESFPRSEIRDAYTAAHDIHLRLFSMRNQLEQLESRRESIVEQHEKLRILLNLAEINKGHGTEALGDSRTKVLPGTRMMHDGERDIAADIITAQERERIRVARQLTDGPAQVLANMILRTEIVQHVAERNPDQVGDELAGLRALTAESLLDIRRTILELRPLPLDELGLVATLRRYVNDFGRETGSTVTVNGAERDDTINPYTRVALFRLIQLALGALVTPGVGTQVVIDVRFEDAQLLVRLDASSLHRTTPAAVERFVNDDYIRTTVELIGANVQREAIANGMRLSIVVPLGLE
ncbi:MAG: hypothetical protein DCC58_14910 [Chloroflexi bacterium]|nr:MAG: hypothetical protein DCC58_14910 [Chloroflexota bacterium]